ncbi:MAG: hypothetical protein LBV32_05560 [Tannerellaceae bacterium]|jgi:uncharacterized membrane protein|nr:hypothetical protein [Tannerellaceae bacterium]
MKAAFGTVITGKEKVAIFIWLATLLAYFIYAVISKNQSALFVSLVNLIMPFIILRQRNSKFIQITDHDRLLLGASQIEIKSINRIELVDEKTHTLRVHYTFQEQPRKSSKIMLKEDDRESFLDILRQINPHVEIH